jgi:hypothetical protein
MPTVFRPHRILALAMAALLSFSARGLACRDAVVPGGDWITADGKVISATEGGIIKIGATWYMWGLDRSQNNSTFIAVVLYKSPDLVHWTFVKQIMKASSNALINNNATVERAKILHNPKTGKFVMWMHYEGHNAYNVAEVAYATADAIDGDFVFQDHFQPLGIDSRDINVYQDADGSAYLLCTTKGNQNVSLFSLDSTYTKVVKEIFRGNASDDFECEGHSIVKSGGVYFWLMSWCTGWNFNDNHYYTATSLAGPWTARGNIAAKGANTFESQVGWAFPMPGANGVDFVFMGDRWSVNDFSNSRMVMLPMRVSGTALSMSWYDRWYPNDTGWTAGASSIPDGVYQIKVRGSGKFLQPSGGSTASGTAIVQAASSGTDAQKWRIENQGGSNFRVTNVGSGLPMEVSGQSTAVGAKIDQYTDNGGANQRWHVVRSDSAWWRFVNVGTLGKAMVVDGASTADGAAAVLGTFSHGTSQEFELVPANPVVSGSSYELVARHSGKAATLKPDGSLVQSTDSVKPAQVFQLVSKGGGQFGILQGNQALQVKDASIAEGAKVVLGPDTGLSARWMVSDAGSGWYSVTNACTGKSLDVDGGATATGEGIDILQYRYYATTNQQWKLKSAPPSAVAGRLSESVVPASARLEEDGRTLRIDAGPNRIDRVSILTPQGRVLQDDMSSFSGERMMAVSAPATGLRLVRLQGDGFDRTVRLVGP